jgi:hypothetical protein
MDLQVRQEPGLVLVFEGHDRRADPGPPRGQHHRQHADDRTQRTVERELAGEQDGGQRPRRDDAVRGEQANGRGQIEAGPDLAQPGRSQVDRDAPIPLERVPAVAERGAHAALAFAHRGIGQAEHRETGKARGRVDLDAHQMCVDAEHGRRQGSGEQRTLLRSGAGGESAPERSEPTRAP